MTPVTFAAAWARAVAANADQTFLVFEGSDGHVAEWTYQEFDNLVARTAAALTDRGVAAGDAVHLALTNSPAFVALWLATNRLGAWMVPSDPMGRADELRGHIERTKPAVGCCARGRADVYREAAGDLPIFEVDEDDVDLALFGDVELADWPAVAPLDRAAVMFTSGTTGRPKGVEITQANYAFVARIMAERSGLGRQHRALVVLPMFHGNAQYYMVAPAIWAGASVALMHAFSATRFLAQAARHGATHASLFAAPMRMILARGADPVDGLALQSCWFAMNVDDAQYEQFAALIGCRPRQLYGMTETVAPPLTDEDHEQVPSSLGFQTPGTSVDLRDGEIVVGGKRGVEIFNGYLDDPATTEAAFDTDGWFRTGDKARRDPTGRYHFGGRHSDILKVAGENVSAVEVEQVLAGHPKVLEAAVVARADAVRDEVPVGYAVPADPEDPPTVAELMGWCETRLAKAKQPREITLLDELPRTSVGKIRKFLLRGEAE